MNREGYRKKLRREQKNHSNWFSITILTGRTSILLGSHMLPPNDACEYYNIKFSNPTLHSSLENGAVFK